MNGEIGVIGYGAVGAATVGRLAAAGRPVSVAQRQAPANLPSGVDFRRCDALDASSVRAAVAGAAQIVLAIGLPYVGAVWREAWPKIIANFVDACAAAGARLVFFDNLYMYGPQTAPLSETTPLQPFGVKPAARVAATRIWMAASEAGRLRVAAVRAPDFYGPGAPLSHLGDTAFGAIVRGGRASFIGSPDTPHDFAYVPDCARAVDTLLDAPDDDFGQAWHVPCAPTRTPRKSWRSAPRRSASRRRRWACRQRSSARSACSSRRCANSPKCASNGTVPTASTRAASPPASGATRRRSKSVRQRLRGGFATARPSPAVDQRRPRARVDGRALAAPPLTAFAGSD